MVFIVEYIISIYYLQTTEHIFYYSRVCLRVLARVYDMMYQVSCNFLNNIDLNYWFYLFVENILNCFNGQLEQHRGGAQQVAGPPAPLLICQWQHSEQVSF